MSPPGRYARLLIAVFTGRAQGAQTAQTAQSGQSGDFWYEWPKNTGRRYISLTHSGHNQIGDHVTGTVRLALPVG